ncbi:UvrD-helicase domain-containing protein [Kamptonema cortianum]|nr:UvrD-helicase domain-containing protein [Oscillatoria laete-virens]MDK3159602.1 UvrD-helicase domain-containing protein [Kamptonema cortianum]MDL5048647.1 UvrD-helicase domain-containing protein [Oscillatoria amoena NRMC-F 0135]MDL5053261.1 UvrD-helicase domain-containing protein [Oscillatoria laete-virens NRMC-F 0139]
MSDTHAPPADQAQRVRFIHELGVNFSVQASAGAGKTTAIVERIARFALDPSTRSRMRQLVVVTYTVKAAEELRQRARQKILQQAAAGEAGLEDVNRVNQAFFGTIHSFCVMLVRRFGFLAGITAPAGEPGGLEDFWPRFLAEIHGLAPLLDDATRANCSRLTTFDEVARLALKCAGANTDWRSWAARHQPLKLPQKPRLNAEALDDCSNKNPKSQKKIDEIRRIYREFCQRWNSDTDDYLVAPPENLKGGGKDFEAAYANATAPVHEHVGQCKLLPAIELAWQFEAWRAERGFQTFQDQINGALRIFERKDAARAIRREGYHVLLDEAQDTDPRQFELLTQVARPVNAPLESLLLCPEGLPEPGRFCMVGDMKQLIYSSRSSMDNYRRYHELIGDPAHGGEQLAFLVTFRCSRNVIALVNATFEKRLNGRAGQANYTKLEPRDKAPEGQVCLLRTPSELAAPRSIKAAKMAALEADFLVPWIQEQGLEKLRARRWSEVAVLMPRNGWFQPFADAFERHGMAVQMASGREKWMMQPAVRWSAALLRWMNDPRDEFELAGILREIYGVSDRDIYHHIMDGEKRGPLSLASGKNSSIDKIVRELRDLRGEIAVFPLGKMFRRLCQGVDLEGRLGVLPCPDAQRGYLRKIQLDAAIAAAEGIDLAAFIDRLMNPQDDRVAEEEKNPGAIQLYSMHMSKGLEWDAVIIPMLTRGIVERNDIYPQVYVDEGGEVSLINGRGGENAPFQPQDRLLADYERLAYVALTRARQTIVLVDDTPLSAALTKKGRGMSLLRILGGGKE